MGDDCGEDFHTIPLKKSVDQTPLFGSLQAGAAQLDHRPCPTFPLWIGGEEPVHEASPADTERRPWRLEKSILCGRDMLGLKISPPPKGDEGIGIPKLVYHMQGLVSLNRLAPVLLKSRHPHAGKWSKNPTIRRRR